MTAGAWDCHVHVFGPAAAYPFARDRTYTPPDALPGDLERMHSALGVERFVLVQPSPYGANNRRLLDALRALGARARGIVDLPSGTPDFGLLRAWGALGVRGIRINLASGGPAGPERLGEALRHAAPTAETLGWQVELHVAGAVLALLPSLIGDVPVPVVLDHFGRARAGTRHEQTDLDLLARLLGGGRVWIKLSAPYRLLEQGAGPADAARLAGALVRANPERLVWGSDWPHTGRRTDASHRHAILPFRAIAPGAELDRLRKLVPDEAVRARILCDNPKLLYA